MLKITGSKFDMDNANDLKALLYKNCIGYLLESNEVKKLKNFKHHYFTTRFQHSLNVSYYSYCVCKYFGLDYRSAARAGLMHDLYFFENTSVDENGKKFLKNHPAVALENSEKFFELNDIEKDAIANHMWPCLSSKIPHYKESMIVSLSDKFCAVIEFTSGSYKYIFNRPFFRNFRIKTIHIFKIVMHIIV